MQLQKDMKYNPAVKALKLSKGCEIQSGSQAMTDGRLTLFSMTFDLAELSTW